MKRILLPFLFSCCFHYSYSQGYSLKILDVNQPADKQIISVNVFVQNLGEGNYLWNCYGFNHDCEKSSLNFFMEYDLYSLGRSVKLQPSSITVKTIFGGYIAMEQPRYYFPVTGSESGQYWNIVFSTPPNDAGNVVISILSKRHVIGDMPGATSAQVKRTEKLKNDGIKEKILTSVIDSIMLVSGTAGTVTDIDGNVYRTVTIGTQVWMKENLKVTKYRNGNAIGTTTPVNLDISGEATPKNQWTYIDENNNISTYGRLYTWYTVTDSRNICPVGWHVPSDSEWITLTDYLGGASVAGGKMKVNTAHWASPNSGADNGSGFTALPGGCRYIDGTFFLLGLYGFWWSASEHDASHAWSRDLTFDNANAHRGNSQVKNLGFSVRCVRD